MGLTTIRYVLPAVLVIAGFVILFVADDSLRWDGWAMCVGAGPGPAAAQRALPLRRPGRPRARPGGGRARVLRRARALAGRPGEVAALVPWTAVPFSVQLGLIFALLTALGSIVGFFLKHKGAVQAPPVDWRHPLKSSIALFRTPIYTLGCVVATTSLGLPRARARRSRRSASCRPRSPAAWC